MKYEVQYCSRSFCPTFFCLQKHSASVLYSARVPRRKTVARSDPLPVQSNLSLVSRQAIPNSWRSRGRFKFTGLLSCWRAAARMANVLPPAFAGRIETFMLCHEETQMPFRAIGSSYLIRQLPGSERVGGLRVTLYPRSDNKGTIETQLTDWLTGNPHKYPMPEMADIASQAIVALAKEHSFDQSELDIKLDHFLFHDVDSNPRCYEQAARSAFRAALESLLSRDNPFGPTANS